MHTIPGQGSGGDPGRGGQGWPPGTGKEGEGVHIQLAVLLSSLAVLQQIVEPLYLPLAGGIHKLLPGETGGGDPGQDAGLPQYRTDTQCSQSPGIVQSPVLKDLEQ